MTPWLDDGDLQLYHGDAITVLASLPAGIAQTCITSPPYWGLRDYGTGTWAGGDAECPHTLKGGGTAKSGLAGWGNGLTQETIDRKVEGYGHAGYRDVCGKCGARRTDDQLGLEATPNLYVDRIVAVFREVRRVLRDDGTLWLNLGDSYASSRNDHDWLGGKGGDDANAIRRGVVPGLKPKDLVGIPWRVAFALQNDGWYLRSDIIWSKPNPMPESVTDRPTKAHEYVFLFSKQPRYFYDADAIREPPTDNPGGAAFYSRKGQPMPSTADRRKESAGRGDGNGKAGFAYAIPDYAAGRNRRSVWTIPTEPFPEAHFATYPQELVRPCILAGTSEHGGCPSCGSPFVRQAARETVATPRQATSYADAHGPDGRDHQRASLRVETTGWSRACSCAPSQDGTDWYGTSTPQLVLDPFIGSGTTALVARKHGRRCIGIDLSADYLEIAAKRTRQLSLFGTPEEAP